MGQESFRTNIFPTLLKKAKAFAEEKSKAPQKEALAQAREKLDASLARLEELAARNPQISREEIEALKQAREESLAALQHSRLRLDSLRLVWQS